MAFKRFYRRKLRKRLTFGGLMSTASRVLPAAGLSLATKNPMPMLSALGSEVKRFVTNLTSDGTLTGTKITVNSLTNYKQCLSLIPRNITSQDTQVDNRFTRKVWLKGAWLRIQMESGIATGYQSVRVTVVRSHNNFEDLSLAQFYVPHAATRGVTVLYDKYFNVTGKTDGNGRSSFTLAKFIKINKRLLFSGTNVDGSDTDDGTVCIYVWSNDPTGIQMIGSSTLSYREMN